MSGADELELDDELLEDELLLELDDELLDELDDELLDELDDELLDELDDELLDELDDELLDELDELDELLELEEWPTFHANDWSNVLPCRSVTRT